MIIIISFFSSLTALGFSFVPLPFVLAFIFGGLNTSLYSIGLAYMNDHIKSEQSLAASTTLILINGMGAMFGPLISGTVINITGPSAFFISFAILIGLLCMFGIYRARVGDKVIVEEQGEFIPVPARSSPSILEITEDY